MNIKFLNTISPHDQADRLCEENIKNIIGYRQITDTHIKDYPKMAMIP